ncbi:MAG: DNA cytosine methyltransferase [Dehalococcoidia bacterium]|nr:DNA cytosine methyltransferase [Dehalococcoidia bacterium]
MNCPPTLTSVELCAGAGGQALGLERAGFQHAALVEIEAAACETLRRNRPLWNVLQEDLRSFDGRPYSGIDLLAGGIPCPPFSIAGKQLGREDERNLFPSVLRLVGEIRPEAVMVENVRGLLERRFDGYRAEISTALSYLGYEADWRLLHASDFGLPQLRPRVLLVALRKSIAGEFKWPEPSEVSPPTVGEVLFDLIASRGWPGAAAWRETAAAIAPTIVGGSHKHGGPDLGPVRARRAWAKLGVDGIGLADEAPGPHQVGAPRLTLRMAARLQGFPDDWQFAGSKTTAYRQAANAFPPQVAGAVGKQIALALGSRQAALLEA